MQKLCLGLMLLAGAAIPGAFAQEAPALPAPGGTADEIKQFCTNISDAARDRRYLLQKDELERLRSDVDDRIAIMEKRKADYEEWLTRRDAFMKKAETELVGVYKTMKADAAAPQLEKMNVILASAIIMKLPPRQSGLILSEMDPEKAAAVASIMSSASDPNTSKDRS